MIVNSVTGSSISRFYKLSIPERLEALRERGFLTEASYRELLDGRQHLTAAEADKLIENVIGVFSLPMAVGLNLQVNDRHHVVPMVVEEPSIVAAVSSAAKIAAKGGGFRAEFDESLLIGQIQVVDIEEPERVKEIVLAKKQELLDLANSLHPRMIARGGGARDLEVFIRQVEGKKAMVVVHLLVETCDAMGANLVNTMCEGIAPLVEKHTGGEVFLRILSNLTDRSMVRSRVSIPCEALGGRGRSGEQVRDGIVLATDLALADPYRAATHNKGVMNGIDAVALATGNDWRAIEAAAHAYAGRGHGYTSLTQWSVGDNGDLVGTIELPLKVGTVGGPVQSNPAVRLAHTIMGVESAKQLAEVMASVGLAQNLAALRALSTEGIQAGHMTLHARSCAVAAGAQPEIFDQVVDLLVESGEIKVWKAKEIVATLNREHVTSRDPAPLSEGEGEATAAGHGKVILFGEHAAVYGSHALAAPIPLAIQSKVTSAGEKGQLLIPRWGVEGTLEPTAGHIPNSLQKAVDLILGMLGIEQRNIAIEIFPQVPRAMGLGCSAALVVAVTRALSKYFKLDIDDERVNEIAFACEKIAHGTPSGIDNTLATYGRFTLFRKGDPPLMKSVEVPEPLPLIVGMSGVESLTAKMVARVREAWTRNSDLYERIFSEIRDLTLSALDALKTYNLEKLGELMNVCHGLLCSLQVSSREIEDLIAIAREHGALGAKLTGGGGGGSIIALCPPDKTIQQNIAAGIRRAGYEALFTEIS